MTEIENKGVQELIDQLRTEGVEKAKEEAKKIVKDAEIEAKKIIQDAEKKAEDIRKKSEEDKKSKESAFNSSLNIASRDVCITLKNEIISMFKLEILKSVKSAIDDKEFIEKLIVELGKKAVEGGKSGDAVIIELPIDDGEEEKITNEFLNKLKGKLEKGVELKPTKGSKSISLKFKDSGCQVEINDEMVVELMSERLVPRFRKYLEGFN